MLTYGKTAPGIPAKSFSLDLEVDTCCLRVGGELDDETAAVVACVIDAQIAQGCVDLTVDLDGLTFFDLRGLAALCSAQSRLREHGGRLRVVNGNRLFTTVVTWWGADDLLDGVSAQGPTGTAGPT